MKILLLGAGGVGQSLCTIAAQKDTQGEWLEQMVVADRYIEKANEVTEKLNDPKRFIPEAVNALNKDDIVRLAKKYEVGLIITCLDTDPFNLIVMDACLECDCHYIDMGLTLTERDTEDPTKITKFPGEDQFEKSQAFIDKKLFAVCACGVEPGMIDFFAKYCEKYYFDEIEEMGVRDGGNLAHPTNDIPFGFSIFQTAVECNLGPILWEKDKGFYSTEPLSLAEEFWLPGGIGPTRMTAIEHSESMNMARHIGKGLKKTTFKIAFGEVFEDAMKNLKDLGMINMEKVNVNGVEVCPLEVLGVTAPNPKDIGKELVGRTCAGLWVKGKKDGKERQIYMYQYADNQECIKRLDCQAVVAQTAVTPALVAELISTGKMDGPYGARVPEEYNPDPVMALLADYKFPAAVLEMESEYREAIERQSFLEPLKK